MTPDQVKTLTEPILRAALGAASVEGIVVREDDDWAGEPSLTVDVFVVSGKLPIGGGTYLDIRRRLSEALSAEGERRFAYLRVRDKKGEAEEERAAPRHA